ncbi:hypothetical protein C8A05DRAFT_19044 [Staphylotrichum tortipilum]|uniref:Uncharacterized protein n=1 Tax=Staphylotrichum tortipilum TaxID=2831512 RepID=A0AAN6ME20_9PEZI|nr:hypothetical protein C8A05DRAFT_19044 [Staphylotrichum longicolle]
MAPSSVPVHSLGIAIDHRIRRLIQPVEYSPGDQAGKHISILNARGMALARSKEEIAVTAALASPGSTGGIAVILQQPRDNHPFQAGAEAVIAECDTLRALEEVFFVVSGGKLELLRDISVIDLLPYTSNDDWTKSTFEAAQSAIAAKKPDVVLCAGKKPLPKDLWDLKGDMFRLESMGVGAVFDKHPFTKIRNREGNWIKIRRVNGFHPSHALNYCSESSCLRQLLFLCVVETCAVYRTGSWNEEDWMTAFRERCSRVSHDSTNSRKFIPDYVDEYLKLEIPAAVFSIQQGAHDLYNQVISSGLPERLNDASLLFSRISHLTAEDRRQPKWAVNKNTKAIDRAAQETLKICEQSGWDTVPRFREHVVPVIQSLRQCVAGGEFDLKRTSQAFLTLAVTVEKTLGDILEKEKVNQAAMARLAADMGALGLGK